MSDLQVIFQQYLAAAQQAMQDGDLKNAYVICEKMLEIDPDYEEAKELKGEIEQRVNSYNDDVIQRRITELAPLWNEGAYDRLVKAYMDMFRDAPRDERVRDLLAKAQDAYRKSYGEQRKNRLTQHEKKLNELLAQDDYRPLLAYMLDVIKESHNDQGILQLNQQYREKLIDKRIAEKHALFESQKYDEIVNLLYQLREIDQNSPRVKSLLQTYRKKLLDSQIDEKGEWIYKALTNTTYLLQRGKYEQAVQAAKEILHADPTNKQGKQLLKEATAHYEDQLQKETEEKIKLGYAETSQEAQTGKPTIRI